MEDTLFGLEEHVSFKDVPTDLPSAYRRWAFRMIEKGHLEPIVQALVRAKKVRTAEEAIRYLAEVNRGFKKRKHIARQDFDGNTLRVVKRLRNELALAENGQEEGFNDSLFRFHGIVGHIAIPQLFLSEHPRVALSAANGVSQQEMFTVPSAQRKGGQSSLFSGAPHTKNGQGSGIPVRSRTMEKRIRALNAQWKRAVVAVKKGGSQWFEQYRSLLPFHPPLQRTLVKVFGETILRQLVKHKGPLAGYLLQLTLMSWANAAVYAYGNGRRILFREAPVLAHRYGVNGGRVDALELVAIDGERPNAHARKLVSGMVRRYDDMERSRSVGEIVRDLENLFGGATLSFQILDWKFAVGDSPDLERVVAAEEVWERPLPKHVNQLMRYLTLATLDYHLARRGAKEIVWDQDPHFRNGTIVYFLPFVRPIVHTLSIRPEEKEKFFTDKIVQKWTRADERATIRTLSNFLVGHVVTTLKGKTAANGTNGHAMNGDGHRVSLESSSFLFGEEISPMERMVERYRRFADSHHIFEIAGVRPDGGEVLVFHLDRLKRAVEEGAIPVEPRFTWEQGGKVLCLLHDDKNPSLHIHMERRFVKCYACGAFARFSEEGMASVNPEALLVQQRILTPSETIQKLVIPARHEEVMSRAHVVMHGALIGSRGERYLREERHVDPDRAFAFGVGFCDDARFFNEMLDFEVSFEELVRYGFIGFSSRVPQERSLASLLSRRDISSVEIKRVQSFPKGSAEALPYSVLGGRVTFPLTLDKKVVNFYGRDVLGRGKRMAHRKLPVGFTNIPPGMFNEEPLISDREEIFLVEAPIDALIMTQMGYWDTTAVVGVKNFAVLELVARAGKKVALAFDNDEPGRNNTNGAIKEYRDARGNVRQVKNVGLLEWFEKRGFQGKVRDFTSEFVAEHGGDGWKDWNDLWKQGKVHG